MDGTHCSSRPHGRQVVLVLQGGGALGAYQAGVFEAMHESGIEPDWVIGTSIGAINAALIAGNAPADRLPRLRAFWDRVAQDPLLESWSGAAGLSAVLPRWATLTGGVPGFFRPNLPAFWGLQMPLTPERAGYYSTAPLADTLAGLIDAERLATGTPRLTVGAANVGTGAMHYFDSRDMPVGIPHVMASGALPPAFPAVRIDGELWWDGGILSNTPVEVVFDDNPRRDSLVFAVHIWNPSGPEPDTIAQVLHRQKDLQYASRAASHIKRQQQMHRLRHVINELTARLSPEAQEDPAVRALAGYGCRTVMHVVRLMAPDLDQDDHAKDIDFSRAGIRARWAAGLADTRAALQARPWEQASDPLEGFVLHELRREVMPAGG